MKKYSKKLIVIMPCKNEADNLHIVVAKLRALRPTAIVIGLDPGTTDKTRAVAEKLGCEVVSPKRSGYDPVVQRATTYALETYGESILFYTDAGNKYDYAQVPEMIEMIENGDDMVMGVRKDMKKTMMWHQKLGTKLILLLINLLMRQDAQDISPFRVVRSSVFERVTMIPQKYRWPSELLVKSYACKLRVGQIDIISLPRLGSSKVSGSVVNSLRAGLEMFSSLQFINYSKEPTNAVKNT